LGRPNGTVVGNEWKWWKWIYIYIYIYRCVCVCVCVCASLPASFRVHRLAKKDSYYSDLLHTNAIGELLGILVAQDKADEVSKMQQLVWKFFVRRLAFIEGNSNLPWGMLQLKHTYIESQHESLQQKAPNFTLSNSCRTL
jgi:hypothetical protein